VRHQVITQATNLDRKNLMQQPACSKLYHDPDHISADVAAETTANRGEQIIQTFAHDFLTTDETAQFLRCEPQTIRKAVSQKGTFWGLRPRRVGRRLYFAGAEVRALMEAA
jgi:hypothetical protein